MVDLTGKIIGAESSGNPFARNPRSSAAGLGGFIDSTWLNTVKRHRPDLAAGKSDAELLRLKFDPTLSREMTSAYAGDNQNFLRSRGVPINDGSTYLAHFAGPAGAAALYANPAASVEATLGPAAVRANPHLRGMSGQDAIDWAGSKMSPAQAQAAALRKRFGTATEGGATTAPPTATQATGTDRLKSALSKYDQDWIDIGKGLQKRGLEIASSYGNKLGAYGGAGVAALGGFLEGMEGEDKKAHDAAIADALLNGGGSRNTISTLLQSSDPAYRKAGVEMLIESQKAKPTEWVPTADGRAVVNKATGETRLTGVDKVVTPTDVERRAAAAGLKPGTPEFNDYVLNGPEKRASQGNPISNAATLRKEFDDLSKDYRVQLAGADRVRVGADTDTPQGDIALVYGFMKMLDPGSVVREGEFATAENTGGVPDRVRVMYNKAISGERLTPEMRKAFLSQADEQIKSASIRQDALSKRYTGIAERGGIDPQDVVTTYPRSVDRNQAATQNPDAPRPVRTQTIDPSTGQPTQAAAAPPQAAVPNDPYAEAMTAIANGADRGKVLQRLQERGFDPQEMMRRERDQAPTANEQFYGQGLF